MELEKFEETDGGSGKGTIEMDEEEEKEEPTF